MTRFRAMQVGAVAAGVSFVVTMAAVWAFTRGNAGDMRGRPEEVRTAHDTGRAGVSAQEWQSPDMSAFVHGGNDVDVAATRPSRAGAGLATMPVNAAAGDLRMTNDVRVYQMVQDAVVNILATKMVRAQVSTGNAFMDQIPQFQQFQNVQAQSLGSGFVIHRAGYIITNEHVVEGGTEILCMFSSGEKLAAKVIATDNEHDLAVLKVEPKSPLKALVLGESEDLMIGEPVYAIGNPFGFSGTMTRGIVSAVDRTLEISKDRSYKGLIQTDASINPGNSGGPLLNAYGQVVGINTAIKQGATGIGFAISVSSMRDLLPAFLNPETLNLADRAQIGFGVEEKRTSTPPATVSAAVLVKQVQEGSAAEKAGLKPGDQLLAVGGTAVSNVADALVDLAGAKAGDTLALSVGRGGKTIALKIPVTKAPPPRVEDLLLTRMGLKGETVTEALVKKYDLAVQQGVLVREVEANSPAAAVGIAPGDVVLQVGPYRVSGTEDMAALLGRVKGPVPATVLVVRDRVGVYVTLQLR